MPTLANPETPLPIADQVIRIMTEQWDQIGPDLPRNDDGTFYLPDAIEVAVNELLDKARELGFICSHQGEEIGAMGICVREEGEA